MPALSLICRAMVLPSSLSWRYHGGEIIRGTPCLWAISLATSLGIMGLAVLASAAYEPVHQKVTFLGFCQIIGVNGPSVKVAAMLPMAAQAVSIMLKLIDKAAPLSLMDRSK